MGLLSLVPVNLLVRNQGRKRKEAWIWLYPSASDPVPPAPVLPPALPRNTPIPPTISLPCCLTWHQWTSRWQHTWLPATAGALLALAGGTGDRGSVVQHAPDPDTSAWILMRPPAEHTFHWWIISDGVAPLFPFPFLFLDHSYAGSPLRCSHSSIRSFSLLFS